MKNLQIGVQGLYELFDEAILPGAGAWIVSDPVFVSEAEFANLALSYIRGGAAGAVDFQIQISPYSVAANVPTGAEEWLNASVVSVGAVAAGVDTQTLLQGEYYTFTPTSAAREAHPLGTITLGGTVERFRIRLRESGNVGAPGTVQVSLTVH